MSGERWAAMARHGPAGHLPCPAGRDRATRGCFNALKLCASAFEIPLTEEDRVQFLEDIVRASDKLCDLLDQLESQYPQSGATEVAQPAAAARTGAANPFGAAI